MKHLELLTERYPQLSNCKKQIENAVTTIVTSYRNGGKILLCGNGGSAADCEHIAGELLKGFLLQRTPTGETFSAFAAELGKENAKKLQGGVAAVPLPSLTGVGSAFCND